MFDNTMGRRKTQVGPCDVDGCSTEKYCTGICRKHYNKLHRKPPRARATAVVIGPKRRPGRKPRDFVGYRAAHSRVVAARGKASEKMCVDCLGPAQEWSLNPDARELFYGITGRHGITAPYALNVNEYSPRCITCHHKIDSRQGETY